jgi:hypothetical protein
MNSAAALPSPLTSTLGSHEDLRDLVDEVTVLGPVELTETLMCAKCIGECKIF